MKIKPKTKLWIIGFLSGVLNGLFGSGGGTLLVLSLVFIKNIEDHNAHATTIAVILPLTLISSLIYAKYGILNMETTIKVSLGTMMGAYIGSKVLNKIPINILRKLFGSFMIIAAIRMVIK